MKTWFSVGLSAMHPCSAHGIAGHRCENFDGHCYRCEGVIPYGDAHADVYDCLRHLQDMVAALKAVVATLAKDLAAHEGSSDPA